VGPAAATGHRLVAIAARDRGRAEAFAEEHGVERVVDSYDDLINDPEIDVVYNPLPNGLHGPWNIRSLRAGKHVLSEKPSASNAAEALAVEKEVRAAGTTFMEAFHYLFHPLTQRLLAIAESGNWADRARRHDGRHPRSGRQRPALVPRARRWRGDGSGLLQPARTAHGRPVRGRLSRSRLRAAGARAGQPGVDEWLDADLTFPGGATGSARCHMGYDRVEMTFRVVGEKGEAVAHNFVQPHLDDRLTVTTGAGSRTESLGNRSSYTYQLEAFADAVRKGVPLPIDAEDAVSNMALIDAVYTAAGLPVRPNFIL